MEEATEGFSIMKGVGEETGRALHSTFSEFFMNMDGSISNMTKNFIDAIRQILANALALQTIQWMFGGTQMGATMFPSMFAPGKALGGPVSAGKPYTVGENGPEMFIPSQSGTIVPNNKMSGGGQTIHITNHINAQGAVSVAEVIRFSEMAARKGTHDALTAINRGMVPA